MILFDMSNIAFSVCLDFYESTKTHPDIGMMRHLILNKLIADKKKLAQYADEIVFCFDAHGSWRKEVAPSYKGKRASDREKSDFDWGQFFKDWNQMKEEFAEYFPVRCVEVPTAEADDIMAMLAMTYGPTKDVVIVSADKDLLQIQSVVCDRVKQYSPYHGKFITPKTNSYSLFEHVVRGDSGDGVPNILSDENILLVEGKRQKALRTKDVEAWKKHGLENPEMFCKNQMILDRFHQNRTVIDLRKIPEQLKVDIMEAYQAATPVTGRMHEYLAGNRLTKIMMSGGW